MLLSSSQITLFTIFLFPVGGIANVFEEQTQAVGVPLNFDIFHVKINGKDLLPIFILVAGTVAAGLIVKLPGLKERFDNWIKLDDFQKHQVQIIQIDSAIIAGLFVLLAIAFQSPILTEASTRSFIVGMAVATCFPFVLSAIFITIYGFSPAYWTPKETEPKDKTEPKEVTPWQAKMGLVLMIFGFLWIIGDLTKY